MGEPGDVGAPDRRDLWGVSYDAFLLNALDHKGGGARDLDQAPADVFARLSAGTGIPVERLLEMTSSRVTARMISREPEFLETPEGHMALVRLSATGSRQRRQMSAMRGF
jgi:hypothetical protein